MRQQLDNLGKLVAVLGMTAALLMMNIGLAFSLDTNIQGDAGPSPVVKNGAWQPGFKIIPPDPAMYAKAPKPLTNVQCGQCHTEIYHDLKSDGGRHRFSCQGCHKRLHEYRPLKNNWQELMPKCNDCHTVPHGEKMADCWVCHNNPHAVTRIPMNEAVVRSCNFCHGDKFEELRKFPSAHTKLACSKCHTKHGFLPNCNACHKSHYAGENFATCASECHPVHRPREISYKRDVNARTCGACHEKIYALWLRSPSKHAAVNCAACHGKHGYIPACSECHPKPHSKKLLDKFPKCLICHLDPHDPPVKQRGR